MDAIRKAISGKKTYATALGLVLYAAYGALTGSFEPTVGNPAGGPDAIQLLLEAAGLGGLRAGVTKASRLEG